MSASLVDRLHGIIPPVITPLSPDGSFDVHSAERLYRHHLDAGVNGLFLFGSSGEGPLIADAARPAIIRKAVEVVGGRIPLLVGVLAPSTDGVIAQARVAKDLGADAVVVAPPFYFSISQEELLTHFRLVRETVDLPVFVYDIPQTTKIKVALSTMLQLAREGTAIGVKDSSGDAVGFRRLAVLRPGRFRLFTGSELLVDSVLLQGADGSVPGLANVAPEPFVELYRHWQAGRLAEMREVQERIVRLFEVFVSPSGAPTPSYAISAMKIAMQLRGVINHTRTLAPFAPADEAQVSRVRAILSETGVL